MVSHRPPHARPALGCSTNTRVCVGRVRCRGYLIPRAHQQQRPNRPRRARCALSPPPALRSPVASLLGGLGACTPGRRRALVEGLWSGAARCPGMGASAPAAGPCRSTAAQWPRGCELEPTERLVREARKREDTAAGDLAPEPPSCPAVGCWRRVAPWEVPGAGEPSRSGA